jgi:iron complex transport system ATP-binding protein
MLDIRDLSFAYDRQPVLRGITVHVAEGQLCGLFGPNGAGKTTLFKCCLGLLDYHAAALTIDGQDVGRLSPARLARLVAYVPQEHRPPFPFLVRDIVLMGRTPHLAWFGRASRRDHEVVSDTLTQLGIAHLAGRPYNELSGGQRQLVLIARAVAQDTPVILLDEPTSGLDFSNQVRIWEILQRLASRGTAVLACSHDPNHVAWFCHKVVAMNGTGVVAEGTPDEVITEPVLARIYAASCVVQRVAGVTVVLPRAVVHRSSSE